MDPSIEQLSHGNLGGAIEQAQSRLRQKPADTALRGLLVELLCLAGELERADGLLESLLRHHPECVPGGVTLRQLIRAQQARLAFHDGRVAEEVEASPGASLEALVAIHWSRANDQLQQAAEAAARLEAQRQPVSFTTGEARGPVRDCDDSLGDFLEVLGGDGHYYLWQWPEIQSLEWQPPASTIERIWRRARVRLGSGREGEVFVPLTYAASLTDDERLGRRTEWCEEAPGLVTGRGQKLLLVGEDAIPFDQLGPLSVLDAEAACDVG